MNKKNVVIWGYFAKNLGDDLMLKAFVAKFKNRYDKIYIHSYRQFKSFYSQFGVTVIVCDSLLYRIINRLSYWLKSSELYHTLTAVKNTDFVMLGGSLFAELSAAESQRQIDNLQYAVNYADDSYVFGSNFGPYQSEHFLQSYKQIFSKCKSVCFRDKPSYDLFSDLPSVKYAPDIVLSGAWEDETYESSGSPRIIISVINLQDRPKLKIKTTEYERVLANIAHFHAEQGDRVALVSFCKYEGDVEACIRIKALCDNDPKIEIIPYEDFGFLDVFPNAKRIYGSRFHSVILSMYYGVPCVPFIYNEKTHNALMSYCESFHSIDILKLSEYSLTDIVHSCETINLLPRVKESAKGQFVLEVF